MRKILSLLTVSLLAVSLQAATEVKTKAVKKATEKKTEAQVTGKQITIPMAEVNTSTAPEKYKIQLPSGEIIDAYRSPLPVQSSGVKSRERIIIKGQVILEVDPITKGNTVTVLTDTKKRVVVSNAPYVNTLRFNANDKIVKLSGKMLGKSSYKDYLSFWIEDILEIKQ